MDESGLSLVGAPPDGSAAIVVWIGVYRAERAGVKTDFVFL